MKIAIIGSGIAGISAAWALSEKHDIVLFERDTRLGGHTHTHDITMDGQSYRIDSGFIVHNPENYPLFSRFLNELHVATKATEMSFAVHNLNSGLYYNANSVRSLFCQKRNLLSPKFYGMIRDITRFYKECPELLQQEDDGPSIGDYISENHYSDYFVTNHLIPMASALWSSPSQSILDFPAKYLVAFMSNHHMLQISNRPQWRVLANGSKSYLEKVAQQWKVDVRLNTAVSRVTRFTDHVCLNTPLGEERFDQVVFACHSDQALALIESPSDAESSVLSAIRYQDNETILHHDATLLPPNRKAWAAWNVTIAKNDHSPCTVSYCMNILQGIESSEPFVVSLNQREQIAPEKILAVMQYQHPIYTHEMVHAQKRCSEINGQNRSWFCGAYWGFGFHEDGFRTGFEVAEALLAL
ncbi:MAG: FAD-dependent oxidoreductase [Arenimonas sp.]|nr:FAD-dependent oxidoreductase [Arenimonas sp.]